jgi:Fe-Mn family superoxide dismutase
MNQIRLKPLPYDANGLEPYISEETIGVHFLRHHAGYVEQVKELVADRPAETMGLEWIIQRCDGALFNYAAQIWNHDFYWRSMRPGGGGAPAGALCEAITSRFGSFERLRRELLEAGTSHFGSGWLWLVLHRDKLQITTTHDADLPLRHGDTAILCADLWEHAYYIDYHHQRGRYLEAFIEHLANWEFAEANWSHAAACSPILRRASR